MGGQFVPQVGGVGALGGFPGPTPFFPDGVVVPFTCLTGFVREREVTIAVVGAADSDLISPFTGQIIVPLRGGRALSGRFVTVCGPIRTVGPQTALDVTTAAPFGAFPGKFPFGKFPKFPFGKYPFGKLPFGKFPFGKSPFGKFPFGAPGKFGQPPFGIT